VLPLKDTSLPGSRPLLAWVVIAGCAGALLASGAGLLVAALAAYAMWLFAPPVEAALGRPALAAVVAAGALAARAVAALADATGAEAGVAVALGAGLAVLVAYLLPRPRGRILTVSLVPGFWTLVEVPAERPEERAHGHPRPRAGVHRAARRPDAVLPRPARPRRPDARVDPRARALRVRDRRRPAAS
jgi:hypothetical protein